MNFVSISRNNFFFAIESENEQLVKEMLNSNDVSMSTLVIDMGFEIAVATDNLHVVELFLTSSKKPSKFCVNSMFHSLFRSGMRPEVLYLLQQNLPSVVLAEAFRELKSHSASNKNMYLVDVAEPKALKDFYKDITTFLMTKGSVRDRVLGFSELLRLNRFIEFRFQEHVFCKRRWVVANILRSIHEYVDVSGLQGAINKAFVQCVMAGDISMATLFITTSRDRPNRCLAVDQRGFDEAFSECFESSKYELIRWLLCGRTGFIPSADVIDTCYQTALLSQGQPDLEAVDLLESWVSPDVVASVRLEIAARRRAAELAQRKAAQRRRLFNTDAPDIHHYSRARVNVSADDDARARVSASADEDFGGMDEDMGEGFDDEAGEGFNGDRDGDGGVVPPLVDDAEVAHALRIAMGQRGQRRIVAPREVTAAATASTPVPAARLTINQAIISNIDGRIDMARANTVYPDIDAVSNRLIYLIEQLLETHQEKTRATNIISNVLSEGSIHYFRSTLFFLETQFGNGRRDNAAIEVWMRGFLTESISMNSCNQGALERLVTGLRGVNDPQLDGIFGQAEGPHLVRLFLAGNFNIFSPTSGVETARRLAEELVRRGIVESSDPAAVSRALSDFARESIASYVSDLEPFEATVEVTVEAVMDAYDDNLRLRISEVLHSSNT